ncbi:MAG TPA: DUF4232 domain-containing protein [Trebonia sp.]|nr:DUF4232 domain-containing protein [Trebonia sp.]
MRFGKPATVSICIVGAGLLAAGCSSSSSSSSPATSATASAGPATTSAAAAAASSSAATTPAPAQPAASTTDCTVSVLSFALGAKTGAAGMQTTQVVDLTNKGSTACTMNGFPGVDLVGTANGQANYTWPLARSSASHSQVTLQPGGTAHFNLMYLPFATGDGMNMTVTKLVMTPPNTFTQAQLTWNQQVLLQDGATHPATYIGPVIAGA